MPIHSGKELPRGLIKSILKDVELNVEEYLKMR
ncbi:MAG: type II toxin-antitoxin system HicA family toxin [Methanosarcinales archaeon]|nr:type II toxin-antitoxin system HicA family toxin [Methanosarcinales archaeon]